MSLTTVVDRKGRTDRVVQAAQILYEARLGRHQIERLPEYCIPRTLAEGYAVQSALIELIGDTIVGWKVGCTTKDSQRRAATTEPFSGPVLKRDLYRNGSLIPPSAYFTCALQVEFAFRLGKDLLAAAAPFTMESVGATVEAVLPALEVADSRYRDSAAIAAPSLIADGAKAGVLVVGERQADLCKIDLINFEVLLSVNGKPVAQGRGGNVMGDPLKSLHWLANSMAGRGGDLLAGQLISAGTCTGSHMAVPGDAIFADFGSLGGIEINLERKS